MKIENLSATLITQGEHKFYTLTMPIEVVAECCSPNPRSQDPSDGFQRTLDETRADSIANYIKDGGVIPSSIILSAQEEADLTYNSKNKTISFESNPKSFLILDGQHRVFGFRKLMNQSIKYRIPVIIFNDLTPIQEARIFIDINTLQRPVPKELLLDIKKLADRETDEERLLDDLFNDFETKNDSFLLGRLSRFDKERGKISKVTFYDSMKPIMREFNINDTTKLYRIINAFLTAASDIVHDDGNNLDEWVTKATVFKILIAHAKSIITIISDNNSTNIELISEYKRYLQRSLPGSFSEIIASKSYLKTADTLDKKLLRRNVTI